MQLKTILNFVEPYKSFVYKKVRWADPETKTEIEVLIEPRANSRGICSGCGCHAPGYDHLAERRFEFVPLWQIAVYFVYTMRRVDCPNCGVKVEQVPWCDGKNQLTTTYRWFLAGWAKRLSWKGAADAFDTTWQNVFRSVKHVVSWGLTHRELKEIEAIGIDEVQWQKGHKYLTLVYQIDDGSKRLLWIGKDRTTKTFLRFFRMLGEERSSQLKFVCSDMWKPYLKVIAKKAGQAIHVLDRFHIMQKMNKAIAKYDIFMSNYTERTWTMVTFNEAIKDLMKTYIEYPPRKLQSETYTGPITISEYQRFQWVREQLEKDGINIPLPTGN